MEDLARKVILDTHQNGKLAKGVLEVTRSVQQGRAKLVITATDLTVDNLIKNLNKLCTEKGVPCVFLFTRKELGELLGLDVKTSSISLVSAGKGLVNFTKLFFLAQAENYLRYLTLDKELPEHSVDKTEVSLAGWHLPESLQSVKKVVWDQDSNGWKTTYHFGAD